MRRFRPCRAFLLCLFPFLTVAFVSAVTPDRKLLSLIPPTAQMVAGMIAPRYAGEPSSFLLVTHRNLADLNDFMALSGIDSSRGMDQVIMVASGGGDTLSEHSLLVSGHFDQALIYKSAQRAGANANHYRGIAVLEVQPFARERDSFHDVRWLAMMDSRLAVFGTIVIVKQELDRYLALSAVEPALERTLANLRRDDATWCVATLPNDNSEIQEAFRMLDSRLADLLRAGDTLEFGTRYGRRVEFEYMAGLAPNRDARTIQQFLDQSAGQRDESRLLPAAELTRAENGVRGVLKLSRARYEAWIQKVQQGAELHVSEDVSKR